MWYHLIYIISTYLVRLFAGGRHFSGEFPQEVLRSAPRDLGHIFGIVRATCRVRDDDAFLAAAAALLPRPLFVLGEQLALLLEELGLAEAFLEAGSALEGRWRVWGRARELELVSQQIFRALLAYSRWILIAERPPLPFRYLAHCALTRECSSSGKIYATRVQRHFTPTFLPRTCLKEIHKLLITCVNR